MTNFTKIAEIEKLRAERDAAIKAGNHSLANMLAYQIRLYKKN